MFIKILPFLIIVGAVMLDRFLRKKRYLRNFYDKPHTMTTKQQYRVLFIIGGAMFLLGLIAASMVLIVMAAILMCATLITKIFPAVGNPPVTQEYVVPDTPVVNPDYLVYRGYQLEFSTEEFEKILTKHLPYFLILENQEQREKFIKRVRKFMQRKNFVIHDKGGFKEMPILISASAVQLSFGLKKYLLPIFSEIHIYPDEFINYHQSLRIVIGNVSNNRINISWKHFLNGFRLPDGVNVGLHEMAHAYHYQNFAALDDMDEHFMEGYKAFEERSRTALLYELSSLSSLYTLYGLSNEQEFWAESVEIFFEKTAELMALDKSLYYIISNTLNQGFF
ncbi:zinc-dependent peptidase [Ferruginibacter sp. HRS2-29]|uniref:zinc-dependent peptidase n=1 Tax=Ferruginibacter sp. HRS2-29 TaxID=2487334 RepID=UPI0020CDBCC6|nr:zinc-dependent peptidase [Ferruginibacter sp. HRS2-29]MCP9749407.1 hypothetical protein [Ferruginibacter sp. HRS2-29]